MTAKEPCDWIASPARRAEISTTRYKDAELIARYRALTEPVLGVERAEAIRVAADVPEADDSGGTLIALRFRAPGR